MKGSLFEAFRQMLRAQDIGPATWGRAYGVDGKSARLMWQGKQALAPEALAAIEEWRGYGVGCDPVAMRRRMLREMADSGRTLSEWAARHRLDRARVIRWIDGQENIPDIWRNRG